MSTARLVNKLVEIQNREGFTDSQMADLISCSRQLYQMTRTSRVEIGTKILKGAVKAFPELAEDAYIFLTGSADKQTGKADACTDALQTTQDGFLACFKTWYEGFVGRCKKIWQNSREP